MGVIKGHTRSLDYSSHDPCMMPSQPGHLLERPNGLSAFCSFIPCIVLV